MFDSTIQKKVKNLPDDTNTTIRDIEQRITTVSNNVNNGKALIAAAMTEKGTEADASETFEELANKIKTMESRFLFS